MRLRSLIILNTVLFAFLSIPGNCRVTATEQTAAESADHSSRDIRFVTEVVPILTRLSCNSGGCHGKAAGQNGFRLSLLGFEPEFDYEAIVHEGRGRRIFPAAPDSSLLLLKATGRVPHGGGRRLEIGTDDYAILRSWIAAGAKPPGRNDPHLTKIVMAPEQQVLSDTLQIQATVTARFSDGTVRDVTRQAVYESNDPEIADVDESGLISRTSGNGIAAIMARFGEQIAVMQVIVPCAGTAEQMAEVTAALDRLVQYEQHSPMDEFLIRQWRQLGVIPSELADDATFIRRASIDICGTLPTPEEVTEFVTDSNPDKQSRLIDRLLERPEYASYFALKWADILQNRGSGYSTSRQRAGTALFAGWIRDSLAANKPYDQFVTEILTATGSQAENPPALWYRAVRKPSEYVEAVAQAFLGIRIQCAQCHHHPAERWSQADYFGLAAAFSRVGRKGGFADAEVPTDEVIFVRRDGEIRHPRTGQMLPPRAPGGNEFPLTRYDDPRVSLSRWMTSPDNPFFARTMANRIWSHFMGRGLIEPIDDARSSNPPSNPDLLNALAGDFVSGGFDIKQLIRTVTSTRAYRVSSVPRPENLEDVRTFARFYPRRLVAEVLLDGFSQVLEVPSEFPGGSGKFPLGTRAIDLPDENVAANFLDVFGRPARMTACECERADAPALPQALELVNSTEIHRKLTSPNGYAARLAASQEPHSHLVDEMFLRIHGRPPTDSEQKTALEFLESQADRPSAIQSLLWSLLATNEFLFNH